MDSGNGGVYDRRVIDGAPALFRPRLEHWLPVVFATSPVLVIIVLGMVDGAVVLGCLMLIPALLLAGYNGLTSLSVGERIVFRRYGWTLWRLSADHVRVRSGRIGELPIVPAFCISDADGTTGAFPKDMLTPDGLALFRRLIEERGGSWAV